MPIPSLPTFSSPNVSGQDCECLECPRQHELFFSTTRISSYKHYNAWIGLQKYSSFDSKIPTFYTFSNEKDLIKRVENKKISLALDHFAQ